MVSGVTVAVAVVATHHVLGAQGLSVGLDGIHAVRGSGPDRPVAATGGTFRFMAHQPGRPDDPVTYDPCRVLHLVVDARRAPRGTAQLLPQAVAAVSSATGLDIVVDGETDEVPGERRPLRDPRRYGRGWSPALVAWTDPGHVPGLRGRVVGLGGSASVVNEISGRATYVTGQVTLDAPSLASMLARPDGAPLVRAVIMHELGHLVGLAHVDDPGELMSSHNAGLTAFGPGDLRGLAALGRGRCTGPA
jgi:hypothetical protein